MLLNQVCFHIRSLKRHRRATGNPWDFNDLVVDVTPDEATYLIPQADFGQPLAVITHAPELSTWIPRMVRIYEPQNLALNIPPLPNRWASYAYLPYDGSNCTAQRCAFYWRDNQPYIEFWPTPVLSASYKVRYLRSANGVNSAGLTTSPVSNEDADLVEIRSAISLLPYTEWEADEGEGIAANERKRKNAATTLANDERMARELFEAAIRQPTGPRISRRHDPTTI